MSANPGKFKAEALKEAVQFLVEEIQALYTADQVPWIIGYSGGKDSTAVLQLVWMALQGLPAEQRVKPVHVISTDTLVENPIVAAWVTHSLEHINTAAQQGGIPIQAHRLTPTVENSFWVNLIGKGYPAPGPKFRWCTDRLKIQPSNTFINKITQDNGEAILVLGTRKAESVTRAKVMEKYEKRRTRDRLSPNSYLPNCLVYSPVEDWTNDDVWMFLMQVTNPWGYDNKALLTMYQGASADGECPLVVDSSTPSCGDSRFGCWVCTLVSEDKSMTAMITNDQEKEWMLPLLEIRNKLADPNDRELRDFRRMSGAVQFVNADKDNFNLIHGPYKQAARETWLRMLLDAQYYIRTNPETPEEVRNIQLITLDELQEIRRIWIVEKHEIEDSLPRIYEQAMHEPYMGPAIDDNLIFGVEEMQLLRELCGKDDLHYEMTRDLLDVERNYRTHVRRAGLFDALEKAIVRGYYENAEDAVAHKKRILILKDTRKEIRADETADGK